MRFLYACACPRETARHRFILGPPMISMVLNRTAPASTCFCFALASALFMTSANGSADCFIILSRWMTASVGAKPRMLSATSRSFRVLLRIYFAVAIWSILCFVHGSFRHLTMTTEHSRRRKFSQSVSDHRFGNIYFDVRSAVVHCKSMPYKLRRYLAASRPRFNWCAITSGFLPVYFFQ